MDDFQITASTIIVASKQVMAAEVAGETVILDPNSGTYFGLNEVGTRFWRMATNPVRFGEVSQTILAEYKVDAEVLQADLIGLVGELLDNSLVTVVPSEGK